MIAHHELDHDGRRIVLELDVKPTWGALVKAWDKDTDLDVALEALPFELSQEFVDSVSALIWAQKAGES